MLKSVYGCAEEEGGRQCKHADSYLKLYLKRSAVCKGNLSYQPTRTPLCLLNQAVCFVAVVFVCLVCFFAFDSIWHHPGSRRSHVALWLSERQNSCSAGSFAHASGDFLCVCLLFSTCVRVRLAFERINHLTQTGFTGLFLLPRYTKEALISVWYVYVADYSAPLAKIATSIWFVWLQLS